MQTAIETHECGFRPCCTRQEAIALLESLLEAYQGLSSGERSLVSTLISQSAAAQLAPEID